MEPVLHLILRPVQQELKPVGAKFSEEFIRIFGPLHPEHPDPKARFLQHGDGPLGGILPRLVSVVNENHLVGVLRQERRMLLSQRRPQGGHRAVKSKLVQRHSVHIPFHQNDPAGFGFFRQIHGEEVLSFVKNQRLRGV